MQRRAKALKRLLGVFGRDQRANVALIMSLSCVVVIVFVGMGLDYYTALSDRARLNQAADAAALAAVNTAKSYFAANSGSMPQAALVTQSQAAGKTQGAAVFQANLGTIQLTSAVTPSFVWGQFQNLQFSVSVGWQGSLTAHFGPLVGIPTLNLSGTSSAISALPRYLDFYIVTDVSGSMGIPTSTEDQKTLIRINPDNAIEAAQYPSGCQFACHFSGYSGFAFTQSIGMALKLNSVANAISGLLTTAKQTAVMTNQFRVGIYPFIVHAIQAAALTSNLDSLQTIANNLPNYLDDGTNNNGLGSGGTHFDNLTKDLWSYFQTPGTGYSANSTQPFIIMVTDGVNNSQTYAPFTGSWPQLPDTNSPASFCATAKAAGYTVAVLLIPYVPIVDPKPIWNYEDGAVNYLVDPTTYPAPPPPYNPSVPPGGNLVTNMQKCASPSFFFTAGTAAEINSAMQTIFYQAVQQSRLTQ